MTILKMTKYQFSEALKIINSSIDFCCFKCRIVYWFEGMKTLDGKRKKCDKCGKKFHELNKLK